MNRIGLPATGQQDFLSDCHKLFRCGDMYAIEVRHRDSFDWLPTGFTRYPSSVASRFVNDLNASGHMVFRCVLSEVA